MQIRIHSTSVVCRPDQRDGPTGGWNCQSVHFKSQIRKANAKRRTPRGQEFKQTKHRGNINGNIFTDRSVTEGGSCGERREEKYHETLNKVKIIIRNTLLSFNSFNASQSTMREEQFLWKRTVSHSRKTKYYCIPEWNGAHWIIFSFVV